MAEKDGDRGDSLTAGTDSYQIFKMACNGWCVMDDKISGQPPMLLRPLNISDEPQARQAHIELAQDAFDFLLDLRRGEPWPEYLARLENLRLGVDVPIGWVPATFLVAEVEGQLVGRISIRHQLNAYLAEVAGHIGIGVLPDFRRRGYATAILRQSLPIAAGTGLGHVLVTCDVNNVGAINATVDCGGVLENVSAARRSVRNCRFWVEASSPEVPRRISTSTMQMADRQPPGQPETTPSITATAPADRSDSAVPTPPTPPTPQHHRLPVSEHAPVIGQPVSQVTLGVADLRRSRAFYRQLGWQGKQVEDTLVIQVGAIALVLLGRDKLALHAGLHDEQAGGFTGVVLTYNVRCEAEVRDVMRSAERAGARVTRQGASSPDGGYAAIFTDPDGYAWEVAHNPGLPIAGDGSISLAHFSTSELSRLDLKQGDVSPAGRPRRVPRGAITKFPK
jgi:predicted acetyltransferase/predicted lactoylglutathione lyase